MVDCFPFLLCFQFVYIRYHWNSFLCLDLMDKWEISNQWSIVQSGVSWLLFNPTVQELITHHLLVIKNMNCVSIDVSLTSFLGLLFLQWFCSIQFWDACVFYCINVEAFWLWSSLQVNGCIMEFLEINKMSFSLIDPENPLILCSKG